MCLYSTSLKYLPVQKQVIQIPNTYNGIAFDPSGTAFYVGGGVNDNVHAYALTAGVWAEETGSPIALGHAVNPATDGSGVGLEVSAQAAGVAITQDGTKLVVTNYYNDSISILTKTKTGWAVVTKGMDFSKEDQVDGAQFNRILWKGLMGPKPYPATPTGLDLRANRAQLLERYRATSEQVPVQSSQKLVAGTGGGQ